MSFEVKILLKARDEFKNSVDWYEDQLEGLGKRFAKSVFSKLDSIADNPAQYPFKKLDFRECKITDFPFLVVYKIDNTKQVIVVYSIFHTSRRPGKKYK